LKRAIRLYHDRKTQQAETEHDRELNDLLGRFLGSSGS